MLVTAVLRGLTNAKARASHEWRLAWLIVIGCIPAAVVGVLFEDLIEATFRQPALIALLLIVFGLILLVADMVGKRERALEQVTLADALVIGCAQVLALMPGRLALRHHDDGRAVSRPGPRRRPRGSRSCSRRRSRWRRRSTSCASWSRSR